MNLDEFKLDLEAKLAAMTDEQLRDELEQVGCVFDEPWLDSNLDEVELISANNSESSTFEAADSNELALAA
jgi:hypothetical protein